MKKLILASTSPRRKEILSKLRVPFEVQESAYEEDMSLEMPAEKLAEYLSQGKARAAAKKNAGAVIIGADTIVAFEHHRLGKPGTPERAREMLKMLSGKESDIITGVTIIDTDSGKESTFSCVTKVFMQELSEEDIEAYIKTGEPLQKAGAYAIQEIGAIYIERIEGDFFGAMGLPLRRLAQELEQFGVRVL